MPNHEDRVSQEVTYTLMLTTDQKCKECWGLATHLLLGIENEFIGFFCQFCGEELKNKLKIKYDFENENRKRTAKKKKVKRYNITATEEFSHRSPQQIVRELRESIQNAKKR